MAATDKARAFVQAGLDRLAAAATAASLRGSDLPDLDLDHLPPPTGDVVEVVPERRVYRLPVPQGGWWMAAVHCGADVVLGGPVLYGGAGQEYVIDLDGFRAPVLYLDPAMTERTTMDQAERDAARLAAAAQGQLDKADAIDDALARLAAEVPEDES